MKNKCASFFFLFLKKDMSCNVAICGGKYSGRYLSDSLLPAMTVHCTFPTVAFEYIK